MYLRQAKIAFLQGERKGQENLKCDLVRRIKMLEFALRQERCVGLLISIHRFNGPSRAMGWVYVSLRVLDVGQFELRV